MITIYKFPFDVADELAFDLPGGGDAQILTIAMQGDTPCLWARVDTDVAPRERRVSIRGTGHNANGLGRYISTFQMMSGALVFHAFESSDRDGGWTVG